MHTRPNTRLALLEGGVWLPGTLPGNAAPLPRAEMVQVYVRQGEGLRRGLERDGLLRHLVVENGFPLNLRPPGLLPALPFLPLLQVRRGGKGIQALSRAGDWTLEGERADLHELVREARWRMALTGEGAVQEWQASLSLGEDDVEVEALSTLLDRRGALPLPGEHHLLRVCPERGLFLLTGPRVGVRVLTTFWRAEALRLARAALVEAWVPLSERQMLGVYRAALPDEVRVEQGDRERWRVWAEGKAISLSGRGESWVVGRRRIPRRTERPDRLTLLWAARAGTQRRSRRFWRMARAEDVLALSRSEGAGLVEGVVTRSLVRQGRVCPACRASFVVGGACLNPACPSRHGDDDDYGGAPLVHVRGGLFVYVPDRGG
jgi:hypothetical protein